MRLASTMRHAQTPFERLRRIGDREPLSFGPASVRLRSSVGLTATTSVELAGDRVSVNSARPGANKVFFSPEPSCGRIDPQAR